MKWRASREVGGALLGFLRLALAGSMESLDSKQELPSYSHVTAPQQPRRSNKPAFALGLFGVALLSFRFLSSSEHCSHAVSSVYQVRPATSSSLVCYSLNLVSPQLLRPLKSHHAVDWVPCALNSSYACGYLTVPKDYYDDKAGVAHIAMLKVPATAPKSERLGTIVSAASERIGGL